MEFQEGMLVAYKDDEEYVLCIIDYDADAKGYFNLTEVYPSEGNSHDGVISDELIFLAQNFANQSQDITRKLLCDVVLALCRKIDRLRGATAPQQT